MPAKLYFYAPGTTTPKTVYEDQALSVTHDFPIISDSSGRFAAIWAEETEFFDVGWTDLQDVAQDTFQNVQPLADAVLASVALAEAAAEDAETARDEAEAIAEEFGDLDTAMTTINSAVGTALGHASAASGSAGLASDYADDAAESAAAAAQSAADAAAIAGFDVTKIVAVNSVQSFTSGEKTQGRSNIGAASADAPTITNGIALGGSVANTVNAVAALAIDASASEYHTKALAVDSTFTFTGFTASKGQGFALELTLSAGAAPTFPAAVTWMPDETEPTWIDGVWVLGFITFNGGTKVYGSVMGFDAP
jgi:hypothetical protein